MIYVAEEKVKKIVSETLKTMRGLDIELTNEISLIDSGMLDSLSIVDVVQGLQKDFDIEIMVEDITLENFDTIDLIIKFIEKRLG